MDKFCSNECILYVLLVILCVVVYLSYFSFRSCPSKDLQQSQAQVELLEFIPKIQALLMENSSSNRNITSNSFSNVSKIKYHNSRSIDTLFENSLNNTDLKGRRAKVLVVYAYNEVPWHAQNLKFFIDKVVKPPNPEDKFDIDYVFVINGYNLTIDIPIYPNVLVLKRDNSGLDLCGWKVGIDNKYISQKGTAYKYYILMNASIRGPFLPNYIKFSQWPLPFLTLLDEQVKLAGTVCQCGAFPIRIPTMITAMDEVGLRIIRP